MTAPSTHSASFAAAPVAGPASFLSSNVPVPDQKNRTEITIEKMGLKPSLVFCLRLPFKGVFQYDRSGLSDIRFQKNPANHKP